MKSSEQIAKEISDRIAEYKDLMVDHDNNQGEVSVQGEFSNLRHQSSDELESAIHELEHLLEWINE